MECYKLPFIKNIEKEIKSKIEEICKKDKIYKDFKKYFNNQWGVYFKNKTLCLKDIDKKLTDAKILEGEPNVTPIKISNGKIYLNGSVRPIIEESISQAKKDLFKMKVLINNE